MYTPPNSHTRKKGNSPQVTKFSNVAFNHVSLMFNIQTRPANPFSTPPQEQKTWLSDISMQRHKKLLYSDYAAATAQEPVHFQAERNNMLSVESLGFSNS